jgi:hypothetical protein
VAAQYPWYELVQGVELQQGDIFREFPVCRPEVTPANLESLRRNEEPSIPVEVLKADVIVLSQSCDLANEKIDSVILCPIWVMPIYEGNFGSNAKEQRKRKESIRQGKEPALHMLARSDNPLVDLSVVEFKRIYTTSRDILVRFADSCGSRTRLLPPYREHLSQAFARYFMRVGLPSDISPFV